VIRADSQTHMMHLRRVSSVSSPNGLIVERPEKISFGWLKVLVVGGASLVLGATISKEGAAFLEKNEIFVPSDDDDDD